MCTYKKILSDLSGEEHFGIDLSYETEFESIEKEVVKSTDIFATTKTDWSIVRSNSLNLLEYKSKDYRLLHWLLLSIKKENDHNTFTIMLPTINQFIIKYSTTIYPLREKQLYSTINKIIGTIDDIVKNIVDNSINTDESNNLIALLSILDTTIDKSFNANTDNLYLTINKLNIHIKRISSEKKEGSTSSSPLINNEAIKSIASVSFSIDLITNERDANKAFRHLQDIARNLSKFWLTQRINNEKAYQLNRTLTWLHIIQLPASNDEKITMLKPIPQTRLQYFIKLKNESDHETLLLEIEESLSKSPFWIDGHLIAWESLISLNHPEAAQIILDQMALLVKKIPEIITLKFDDGTEFASNSAKNWIAEHCTSAASSQITANTYNEISDGTDWEDALQAAQSVLTTDNLSDAILPLITGHNQCRSDREVFFWKFSQAKLLYQAHKFDLVCALTSWLDSRYSHSILIHWDPVLEERLLELWLSSQNKLPNKEQDTHLMNTLRERLCCLNPMRVLNF